MMKSYCPLKAPANNLQGNGRVRSGLYLPLTFLLVIVICLTLQVRRAVAESPIHLEVEGRPVQTDAPPVIVGGRTLVPVRFVAEALGAQVTWDNAIRSVTITLGQRTALLIIDQPEALVNGNRLALDVPAQIRSNRTFVPLRFVAEALGAAVDWDGDTRTVRVSRRVSQVTGLEWKKEVGAAQLRVSVSEPLAQHQLEVLGDPERLVLTLYPARVTQGLELPADPMLQDIRLEEQDLRVQLTVQPARWTGHRLEPHADGLGFTLHLFYQVLGAEVRMAGATPEIWIHTDGPVSFQTLKLPDPARLVVDIASTLAPTMVRDLAVNQPEAPWLKRIRAGQFQAQPAVARVVIELDSHRPYQVESRENGLVVRFPPHLTGVRWENLADRTRLTLTGTGPMAPAVIAEATGKQVLIVFPDTRLATGQTEYLATGAAFSRINLTQQPDGALTAVITLPYYLGHTVRSGPGESQLVIDLIASPVFGRRIWIDAGHGGSDPGAVSKSGVLEKDLTLDISLELMRLLQEAGAQVMMTRTDDTFVSLYDRPERANEAGAELFISVHINAGPAAAAGTETYYWRNHPQSQPLAAFLQQELVQALGLPDRGVKTAQFVVIREASMPAALVEIAFLSNPKEEQLLLDPAFRQKAAIALKDGVFAYFWQELQSKEANT